MMLCTPQSIYYVCMHKLLRAKIDSGFRAVVEIAVLSQVYKVTLAITLSSRFRPRIAVNQL